MVAELPDRGALALVGSLEGIFGMTQGDRLFRIAPDGNAGTANVTMLGPAGERATGQLVVRSGRPAWIASAKLFGLEADGGERIVLASSATAVGEGPAGLYFLGASGDLFSLDWPGSRQVQLVASPHKKADELVVAYPWVVAASTEGDVWAYNLQTRALRDVPQCPDDTCLRAPRDLTSSIDRTLVGWHEGPPMPFMGRDSRSFLFDLSAWTLTKLPACDNDPGSGADFVLDRQCVYTGRGMRGWHQTRWSYAQGNRLSGEDGPVADDGTNWLWVQRASAGDRAEIWAAPKASCCEEALRSASKAPSAGSQRQQP
jgi:hypothetical protein